MVEPPLMCLTCNERVTVINERENRSYYGCVANNQHVRECNSIRKCPKTNLLLLRLPSSK